MRISDWSSDVCSSDLADDGEHDAGGDAEEPVQLEDRVAEGHGAWSVRFLPRGAGGCGRSRSAAVAPHGRLRTGSGPGSRRRARTASAVGRRSRSEEHTSELQSLMRISYAVFCLKKKNHNT